MDLQVFRNYYKNIEVLHYFSVDSEPKNHKSSLESKCSAHIFALSRGFKFLKSSFLLGHNSVLK